MSNKLKLWHYTSNIALDNILELGVIELTTEGMMSTNTYMRKDCAWLVR
jgi:hypothetical protein